MIRERRVVFLLLVSFIVASMAIMTPVKASPTTYYVNVNTGNDGNTPLLAQNPLTPWKTISHAVGAVSVGDTIIVAPGIYDEAVKIDKQLTLTGQPGAVIQPDNTTPLYDGGIRRPAIYITADGVTVQGFEIDGTHGTVNQGIYGINTDGLTIQNNVIHDMSNDADDVAGNGIIVFGWDDTVNNNLITGNTVYNTARMGIFVGGMQGSSPYYWLVSSGNNVSYNQVYNTWQGPTSGGGAAIQMNGAKDSLITNNKVHDTAAGLHYFGIYIYGSSTGNSIVANEVYNNQYGIILWINPNDPSNLEPWVVFGSDVPAAPAVHYNNIYHNTDFGVWNVASPNPPLVVDATNNWWGDATGPHHTTSWLYLGNPYGPHLGSGDSVTDYVLYDPWLLTSWPPPVGGEWVPVNTLQMLVQLIGSAIAMSAIAASFVGIKRIKRKQN